MFYARWLGRGFLEPHEAPTQKAPFSSSPQSHSHQASIHLFSVYENSNQGVSCSSGTRERKAESQAPGGLPGSTQTAPDDRRIVVLKGAAEE